ncbi:hypothetical protein [Chlamydia psittaci]|uniref:hypothetical protein n=1 Tax=Chlamydia psittaci TaxID=83554 RepID=UPI00027E1470|nr:hypothetical protein [Chlamydia psittaci]EPJ24860.1 putative inner membrane protein [Chlamydia psittaci 09DC77]EPJ29698.1 putative inner membrane protein [Chlamydia psittaci 09DC78]EPL01042.1 putative inner membrane protein [Chlamydia psittaci 09DC79]AFS21168.1 putative inner membrane protein [Chlamydia psittaci MN]AFS26812.1 putative inner membrane protein [Chlamydia psittaci CP3]
MVLSLSNSIPQTPLSLPNQSSLLFNAERDATVLQKKVAIFIEQSSSSYILAIILLIGTMIGGSIVVAFGCISKSLPEMIGGMTVMVASLVCIFLLISMIYLIKCLPSKVQQTITLVNNKTSSLSSFQLLQDAYSKLIYSIIDKEQRIERLKQEEHRLLLRLQRWQEITHATQEMPSSPSNNHNLIS